MSDDLVKRAREALDGVTPGPWRHDGHTGVMASGSVDTYSGVVWATIIRAEQTSETDVERRSWETSGSPDANARFIAASRELVPTMADRIEELEAERDNLSDKLVLEHALTDGAHRLAGKAEAKLAKAVEALEKLNVGEGWAAQIARAALAEINGGGDT